MTGKCFVDSNVWVYTRDLSDPVRQSRAIALIQDLAKNQRLVISVQVISEFREAVRRRAGDAPGLTEAVEAMLDLDPVPVTADTIRRAIDLGRRRSLSWWDSLIVSSAILAGCQTLYTEDMDNGSRIDGVEIVNPFR